MTDWAALHARGLTAKEAANEAGRSEWAARSWSSRHGQRWAAQKLGRQSCDWASLHARGLTARQAARAAGASCISAHSWARRNGVKWPKERLPAKGRPADTSGLTPEQKRDFETLIHLGGYKQDEALAIVTRPRVKVRAPTMEGLGPK